MKTAVSYPDYRSEVGDGLISDRTIRRITAGMLSLITAAGVSHMPAEALADDSVSISAETAAAMNNDYYHINDTDTSVLTYGEYHDIHSGEARPEHITEVRGADCSSFSGGTFSRGSYSSDGETRDDVLIWESPEGEVSYDVNIEETGIYCMEMSYFPLESDSTAIEFSLSVHGEVPFDTASRLTLNRVWVNEHDIYTDSRGNQVRPAQVQHGMWQCCDIGDVDGLFSEPLIFYLEEGEHEITFTSERAEFVIEKFRFHVPEEIPSRSEYEASVQAGVSKADTPAHRFRIEGEDAVYKSDPTLCPTYDNTNYLVSPSDPVKVVYNTLGGGSWRKALQTVTWDIPKEDIMYDGWYRIGIKARQDEMRGLYSNRRIYIDGEVPCKGLEQVKFFYSTDWSVVTPEEDGEDVYVYLTADRDHTITMECVPGEIGDSLRRLDKAVTQLNEHYRSVLMITGPSPDKYTDYYVHEKLPDLVGEFDRLSAELTDVQKDIEGLSKTAGSEAAVLERMTVVLDKCVKKPLKIPSYLGRIKDDITAVSAWMRDFRDQPLEVDYIEFASVGESFSGCDEKFGKSFMFSAKAFFGSFFEDYTTLSDVTGKDAIDVWVSLGRDQAQVVKEMTESDFMQKTGIPVSVSLVVGGVVEATLAGKGPDVALFLGGEFPVNLAARDLLVDMSAFADYEDVKRRFQKNAMTQYQYSGGTYGLPISQTFPMMFYRTDILSGLGFTQPPETWDALIDMLPALQRKYLSVGLVLPPNNISPATEAGHTFAMLLLQSGKNYYNSDLSASAFDSVEAVKAFEMWTEFYTKYSFEQSYDAFSRFRTGEYPVVIANYTFANQLSAASPEIKGLWDFCPVPGTVREDGTVSHAANSSGSGAVIFKKVKNKDDAWEYVKWFTDADTQVRYGTQIEGILGRMGRFDTANTEALGRLSWSEDELSRLTAQRDELVEIPVIPSSYAVTRNIMNAFRETVNEHENPRDTFIWYNRDINDEIARKREDLGISDDQ